MVTTSYQWQAGPTALLRTNDALTAGDQNQVAIASSASGNFFFGAWTDPVAGASVEGRVLFAQGDPIASQFMVNLPSAASQRDASVAGLPDGRYVVAFTDTSADPGGDIRVRARALHPEQLLPDLLRLGLGREFDNQQIGHDGPPFRFSGRMQSVPRHWHYDWRVK